MSLGQATRLRGRWAGTVSVVLFFLTTLPAFAQNSIQIKTETPATQPSGEPGSFPAVVVFGGGESKEQPPASAQLTGQLVITADGLLVENDGRQKLIDQLSEMKTHCLQAQQASEAAAIDACIRRLQAGAGPDAAKPPMADPGTLTAYRDGVGQTLAFSVTGANTGTIWGSDVYTDDSPLATAAVHAGVLEPGQRGTVRVAILPGREQYAGSERHGVTSREYGAFGGSYRIEKAGGLHGRGFVIQLQAAPPEPAIAMLNAEIVGSKSGSVWGTDVYTADSSVSAAAVHAGLLHDGERGSVRITILAGRDHYDGSNRNGVSSAGWAKWDKSFRLEKVSPPPDVRTLSNEFQLQLQLDGEVESKR